MKYPVLFFPLFLSLQTLGQDLNYEIDKIIPFFQALEQFSENIPGEKVYLQFDNTGYYQGDNIWFKCYIVTSDRNQLSPWSKTLYVELLNPGGEIIDKRILKIENGQCHGDFTLNHLPFYSGFYEVRAYTKYMLNFGDDLIFSRLLPVFNKPKEEGNYEEKTMLKYGSYGPVGNYSMKRERPIKGNKVNLRFFPEGGSPVLGVASRIAFEATDETGNPIEITGVVMDDSNRELCRFAGLHEGRGVFTYIPVESKRKAVAEVEYSGKKYRFDMPQGIARGVVMEVDNLSHPDSIGIILRKNSDTPAEIIGLAVLSGGKLLNSQYVYTAIDEISFRIDKTQLPSGVFQIVLFNSKGDILCDRLVFIAGRSDRLDIHAKTDKSFYRPNELVAMEFSVTDGWSNPVNAAFSLSVRDGANEVACEYNILTDLLLMSEIKGYVRNPFYYFEEDDDIRRTALDVLLMVQGWRRYSWKQMAGIEDLELKNLPEQGIETNGKVVSFVRGIPKPNVDVFLLLKKREDDEEMGGNFIESFVTDKQGCFTFVSDVPGRWNMILSVSEKGKKKDHRILLDRVFSPEPKRYRYADLQVSIAENNAGNRVDDETPDDLEEDLDSFFVAYTDSITKAGITEKIHLLPEVTIKAKKNTKEQDIRYSRSTSSAYYDVASELDDIYDRGKYIGDDIHQMLINSNKDFYIRNYREYEFLYYKGKRALFVVNYERTYYNPMDFFKYKMINLNAIKSIYISEEQSVMCQYCDLPCLSVSDAFGCVVLIETYPGGKVPAENVKGVRKTWLEGYSSVKEFYSPNYSELPPELDYRRTLYWNPEITPDETGRARITFYNNSRCKNFIISAETVTPQGVIGIYKKEEQVVQK